ncbi:MAG: MoaD/ThiS family protein [Acidimicrobiaceae bacterium]|nr:MoaD/ThiS family protein [Acidimicrobiaceae bacterium]
MRVILPQHLRNLAKVPKEVVLNVGQPVTMSSLLDTLEEQYPVLKGTIRDSSTSLRRPYVRFFALEADLSNQDFGDPLPDLVVTGEEPLIILGAMAGG